MCNNQIVRRPHRSFTGCFGLLIGCGLFLGCGGGTGADKIGDASITITNGGQPVTSGRVELETDRPGQGSGAELNSSGVAWLNDVAIGDYTVTVHPPIVVQVPGEAAPKKADEAAYPKQFRTLKTSPLKIQVKAGRNNAKFDLKEAK